MYNISLAWKNLTARKKQTLRMILLITVAMCMLMATVLVERGVSEFVQYIMKEVPEARIVQNQELTPEGAESILEYYSKDDRVLDVVMSQRLYLGGTFENAAELTETAVKTGVGIYPYHKGIGEYTDYVKALGKGEVILPQYFNTGQAQWEDNALTYELDLIDVSDWVGKEIKTRINCSTLDSAGNIVESEETMEFVLKIVGTYDNVQACQYENAIYVSPDTLSEMYNDTMSDTARNSEWGRTQSITLITKEQKDVEDIAEETGMYPLISGRDESSLYVFFLNGLKVGAVVLFIAALINIILTLTEEIRERRSEIALLRAMGYENGKIGIMLLFEILMIIGMVAVLVVVFSVAFVYVGNWCIDEFVGTAYRQVSIHYDGGCVAKIIGAGVVAMLATFAVVYYKMEQVNTIEALKGE